AWSQRQPGVRLAQAVSGGATQQREPCNQAVAVHVSENSPSLAPTTHRECSPSVELAKSTPGTIHVELRHAQVRIEGSADPALLRVLLECLRRCWRCRPTRGFGLRRA